MPGVSPFGPMTKRFRDSANAAVNDIRSAGGTPDDVGVRWQRLKVLFPGVPATLNSLAKHWPELAVEPEDLSQRGEQPAHRRAERRSPLEQLQASLEGAKNSNDHDLVAELRAKIAEIEGRTAVPA